jgi:GNAT superfamily N-acetyltransferase
VSDVAFREGRASDLETVYELGEKAWDRSRAERGLIAPSEVSTDEELRARWSEERPLFEFMTALDGGSFFVCEDGGEVVGYAIVSRFDGMDEMAELWVAPTHSGQGVSRGLLERCWPKSPSRELGRLVVAVGRPADLTLFTQFGVMPVSGHWHMRHRVDQYLENRAQELDAAEPGVHVLTPDRAVDEWKRLEPGAIGHYRTALHEFFGRTRNCLATMNGDGHATALCWVSGRGEIGPAVGQNPEDLVPVVLAALDRVAKMQEPESFGVHCTTAAWWLMDRLRGLGFRVFWPAWIMSSVPLPGLDRYLATRPVRLL